MKPNSLLSQLTNLEGQLNHFSFEELTSEEASSLKKSFMSFKYRLEEKVLGPKPNVSNSRTMGKDFELAIGSKERTDHVKSKSNQEEGRLLAKLGNEIKTPINGIVEKIDLLKEGHLTEEQRVQINAIASSSNHILDIINELLEYTNLTSGRERFENIDFNFYGIIKDTMYLCNTLITNNNVALEVDLDTEIPETLTGDPSKLSQILLTLLGNSIKRVEKGSILLKIKLRSQCGNFLVVEFEIRDLHKEAYVKDLKPHAKSLGIGLTMVEGILEILNGSWTTMDTLNGGSVHKFSIPFKKGKLIKKQGSRGNVWKPLYNSGEGLVAPLAVKKEVWEVCLTHILEECMGEIDLLEELIGLFKQNMLDFIGRANIYIPEGNFNGLGFAAHKVKTGLSMMKAEYLYSLVEKITVGCRTHRNLPEIGRLYDHLLLVYPMVEKAIDKELMLLKGKGN